MSDTYNLVVIGAGSAGLVSAYIGAAVKAKVALIEKHKMGGDCLNYGCVPSKALIKSAKFVHNVRQHQKYGVRSASVEFDFAEIMDRVHKVIGKIEPHDSPERYRGLGVECLQGTGEIIDKHTVRVGDRILKTKNIILAMGARPFIPPILGLDKIEYRTSENLWDMRELPKRLVVLGGGPIGCEMAQAFSRLGSQVVQVEMSSRILPRDDLDVSNLISERFRKEGINIVTNATAKEVRIEAGVKSLLCQMGDGSQIAIEFDEILIAVGRRANSHGFDWHNLGVKTNANGTLAVDSYLRVNGDNMFGCGDLVGPYQFTHTAAHQAWYCAVNALFRPLKSFKVDYSVIPWVTFTDPEIAQVGHNEQSAKAAGIPYEVTHYEIDDLDRAIAESEDIGFVKVLTEPGKDRILGATIVAAPAGEMITEYIQAMKQQFGLNKILGTIHPYPTFSEANKFAAGNWKKAHAPEKILDFLQKFHGWRL